jgi:alpha,alpha-trehalase
VPNPFVIAGGRFKEFYYWDSYWIIRGLLVCEMFQTARGMIENFLSIIDRYGLIPNGGRIYYLARSQPPLLSGKQ